MGTAIGDAASVAVDASMAAERPAAAKSIPAESLVAGATVAGRYTIISKLGTGGQGSVYQALDQSSGATVALKIPRPDRAAKRLDREITALRQIQHSGVVRLIDSSSEPSHRYLVMERLGPTLTDLVKASPTHRLGASNAARMGLETLLAIEACHRAGFLHRDVKPSNIALSSSDPASGVKLIDLGLAVRLDRPARKHRKFVGTARYASISTLSGRPHTARDDLIGLWLSLLHVVAGSLPWDRSATREDVVRLQGVLVSRALPAVLPREFEIMRCALFAQDLSMPVPYAAVVRALDDLADREMTVPITLDWNAPRSQVPSLRATMDAAVAWRRPSGTSGVSPPAGET